MLPVPPRPCMDPLNWNLYANFEGELYVPFHDYVQVERTCKLDVAFPQFLKLPRELQLRILCFCSSATLFQLMRVSSATRNEARKLFWSDPGSRYVVAGAWLEAGGFSGHTHDDLAALALVKHVEVEFSAGPVFGWEWDDGELERVEQPPADAAERKADAFWRNFQRCLPRATNVVLKEVHFVEAGGAPPAVLTRWAETCPDRIRVSVSCYERGAGCQAARKSLWQPIWHDRSQPATWKLVDTFAEDTTQSVLPPAKTFRGPVGAFLRMDYHSSRLGYLYSARPVLRIQAMEAYYAQNPQAPIVCPDPECNLRFETPRAWAVHASNSRHTTSYKFPTEALERSFLEHEARLARIRQEIADRGMTLQREWGEEGSEQRRRREDEFLHQLQHDPDYTQAKPPRESRLWSRYQVEMNNEETAYYRRCSSEKCSVYYCEDCTEGWHALP